MDHKNSCDMKLAPRGPAFEDVVDYGRDESIFFRKYIEAWHMATENGMDGIQWADPVKGPNRHSHTASELFDCTVAGACDNHTEHCHMVNMGSAAELNDIFPQSAKMCMNKHLLLSEQWAHPLEHAAVANLITMVNPTSSASEGTMTADKVLIGQHDHTFHNADDDVNWPSSVWKAADKGPNEWAADFKDAVAGKYTVGHVEIRQKAGFLRKNLKVYIKNIDGGETFCNEIDGKKKCNNCENVSGDAYLLECEAAVSDAAGIVIRRNHRFGLADVRVWNGDRFPHYKYDEILRPPMEV